MAGRRLEESELTTMTEHGTQIGARGLSYGTPAAEEMIAERMRKLAESGYCTEGEARSVAVGQLAQEGNLKTEETVSGQKKYLGEVRRGEVSAEERRAQGWLARAKEEAERRGVTLSQVMNERAISGEVRL